MQTPYEQPLKVKVFGISICLGLGVLSFIFFVYGISDLISQMSKWPSLFNLEKRSFYGLGPSFALFSLGYAIYREAFLGKILSEKERKVLGNILFVSVVLTFLVPALIKIVTKEILQENGYEKCEISFRHTSGTQSDYYAKDSKDCILLINT